ncbi:MAG: iron-containing alcohol dehydrogenase family protein [Candidatus Ornithomonoglobus sp.]
MSWSYKQPVEIIFGNGRIAELKTLLGRSKRPVLISDPYFVSDGLAEKISNIAGGIEIFSDISPNPDVSEVNACSRFIRENNNDIIIALGGGSSLDLAKAASIAVENIEEYHTGGKTIPAEHIPIIAVPTTSGTGSEVTCVSVLTDRKLRKKAPIVSESFYPRAALIDPELTYSLPPYITASTGIDVLCHAVEGYWSKGHQPICDALAIHAIELVFKYLPVAYKEPENAEAREKLAEASVIAGLAFTLPKTTSSHACSFPLTSIYNIPHGEACGLTLDYFARINGADARTRELADKLGYSSADALADDILRLKNELGLRVSLKEFNITDEQTAELVRLSHHPNMENNPVKITDEILFDLYNYLRR